MARRHRIQRKIEGKRRYENRARLIVSISLLVIFLIFPLSVYKARLKPVITEKEAMDAVQVARNFGRGFGISTNIIRPDLYSVLPQFTKPVDLVHPPLHIWLLSQLPGIRKASLFSPPDSTAIDLSSFFYLITAMVLYYMALKLFDLKTAVVGAMAYLFSIPMLNAAIAGTRDTLMGAMLTLLFLLIYLERNRSIILSFITGVFFGLCYLTEYELLIILIALAIYKILCGGNLVYRHLAAMFIGFAVSAAPWMLRNLYCGGNPLFGQPLSALILKSTAFAGDKEYGVFEKLYLQFSLLYANIIAKYGTIPALSFFLLSPLVVFESQEINKLKLFFWVCLILVLVMGALERGEARLVSGFTPLAILFGVRTFMQLIVRGGVEDERSRMRLVGAFVVLSLVPFIATMLSASSSDVYVQRNRLRTLMDMHRQMHSGEIVMTNAVELLSYYGEYNTLPMPKNETELVSWQREFGKLKFAVVCPYGDDGDWKRMVIEQGVVPSWFIASKANIYPWNERFFIAEEEKPITGVSS